MNQDITWDDEEKVLPPKKQRINEAHELVFRMWEAGVRDLVEIQTETGYTTAYIRLLLGRRGYAVTTVNTHSAGDIEGVCSDYVAGMKIRHLLKKWKLSNNTLYSILEEKGIPVRRENEKVLEGRKKFLDRAVEMYQEEYPIKEIQAETGITGSTLYQELALRSLDTRSRVTFTNKALDEAVELYQNKRPIIDIELQTGVTPARLYQELNIRGVEKHRGKGIAERIAKAVDMYQLGKTGDEIYKTTRVSTAMLYRVLKRQGIAMRRKRGGASSVEKALELYDKGVPGVDILKEAKISVREMVKALYTRSQNLRSGLPPRVTKRSLDLAVKMYQEGVAFENIEIDTFVNRVQLLAELKNRNLEVRP
jgi:transposase-like protein